RVGIQHGLAAPVHRGGARRGRARAHSGRTGMDKFHSLNARRAAALAAALLAWMAVLALLSRLCGYDPFGTSAYNTYTLQALSWREGRTWLSQDYPHLELEI